MNALKFVKNLIKHKGAPYVYGAKQNKQFNIFYDKNKIKKLKKQYPNMVWKSDLNKKGCCCDCSGFVDYQFQKGYSSKALYLKANSRLVIRVNGVLNKSVKYIPIGSVLYKQGHVGIFIGWKKRTPYYIAEDGSQYNCRINKLKDSEFYLALTNIEGYDINYFRPRKVKIKKRCNAYKEPNKKFIKRKYRKGKKLWIVGFSGEYYLARYYSYNQDCWIHKNNLKF